MRLKKEARVAKKPDGMKNGDDAVCDRMSGDGEIDFEMIELLFFAYRDFISDPDAILAKSGFGRAHHRVVHFVNRDPGMTVADLLETLKITKQSLARVLKQLIDSDYITQREGPDDRRQRRLYPTKAGRELALELARPQSRRIANAFGGKEDDMRAAAVRFLRGMRNARDTGGEQ
ncbi:MAG: winged helix DNA-binding domain protein [Rhizobium sp.]|nr:winged helix DNA-binding domain protein [Rhizobium sp.]